MYSFHIRENLEKEFHKIAKKNPEMLRIIYKKIKEITASENVDHYKNLKKPMQHLKRVHIAKHFVLVFSFDESKKHIIVEDFDHHDSIYL